MSLTKTNRMRAKRVRLALTHYKTMLLKESGPPVSEDDLGDFLADARHWCDVMKLDYAAIDKVAHRNYREELWETK